MSPAFKRFAMSCSQVGLADSRVPDLVGQSRNAYPSHEPKGMAPDDLVGGSGASIQVVIEA